MITRFETHGGLWYYEGRPDQLCEFVSRDGGDVTLRPLDGSPQFTCNGSFAGQVHIKETS